MANRVFPFSVPNTDPDAIKLVQDLKAKSQKTGISFSWMVIKALKEAVKNDLI